MTRERVLVPLALCLAVACAREPAGGAEGLDIPEPPLDALDASVREEIVARRDRVEELAKNGTPAGRAEALGELGDLYMVHKLDDAAETCYRSALELSPDAAHTIYFLGIIHARQGAFEEAAGDFERAAELMPDYLPAKLRLADVYLSLDRHDEARELFDAGATDPGYAAAARYGLGRSFAALGQQERAIEEFERALELQPGAKRIHYALAISLRELGRRDEAEAHLEEFAAIDVSASDPLIEDLERNAAGASRQLLMAGRLFVRGDHAAAVGLYREAVAADPDDERALAGLALSLIKVGKTDEAVLVYRDLLERAPDDAQAHHNLAQLVAPQDPEEAARLFGRATELDPGFEDAHVQLARLLQRRGDHAEALRRFARALEIDPNDRRTRLERLLLLNEAGRSGEALEEAVRLVEEDPGDAGARLQLGVVRVARGELEDAERELRAALDLSPAKALQAAIHAQLGDLYARRHDRPRALKSFERAVALDGGLVDARFRLATALAIGGQYSAAAEHFSAVVDRTPGHLQARIGEATARVLSGDFRGARDTLEEGLGLSPHQSDLVLALATLLATCPDDDVRDGRRALELALAAHERTPSPQLAEVVAMSFAETGDFESALAWQRRLVADAENLGQAAYLQQVRRSLGLYEKGEPLRAPWSLAR